MSYQFPVVIGICLDAEAIWTGKLPADAYRPVLLSNGAFAIKEGLKPLLDLLDHHEITVTFFVPGVTADAYPEALAEIRRHGHELGSHTYSHRSVLGLTPEEERQEIARGIEAVERNGGVRPTAWRSASWEWSRHTLEYLLEEGVKVSCNFQDQIRPYRHFKDGMPTPIVELPVQWHLADAPFFLYGGDVQRRIRPAAEAESVWMEEFDATYDWPGAFFHLTLHVQLIGHPGRLKMLDRCLTRMRGRNRTRFLTCAEAALLIE